MLRFDKLFRSIFLGAVVSSAEGDKDDDDDYTIEDFDDFDQSKLVIGKYFCDTAHVVFLSECSEDLFP